MAKVTVVAGVRRVEPAQVTKDKYTLGEIAGILEGCYSFVGDSDEKTCIGCGMRYKPHSFGCPVGRLEELENKLLGKTPGIW